MVKFSLSKLSSNENISKSFALCLILTWFLSFSFNWFQMIFLSVEKFLNMAYMPFPSPKKDKCFCMSEHEPAGASKLTGFIFWVISIPLRMSNHAHIVGITDNLWSFDFQLVQCSRGYMPCYHLVRPRLDLYWSYFDNRTRILYIFCRC